MINSEQARILGPASDQRVYDPHRMPKRDAQTQRTLEKALGRPVQDQAKTTGEIPNDVLVQMNQVVAQNQAFAAQIPAVLANNQKMEQKFDIAMTKLQEVLSVLAPLIANVTANAKINPATLALNSEPVELPNLYKDRMKKGKAGSSDLPPSES